MAFKKQITCSYFWNYQCMKFHHFFYKMVYTNRLLIWMRKKVFKPHGGIQTYHEVTRIFCKKIKWGDEEADVVEQSPAGQRWVLGNFKHIQHIKNTFGNVKDGQPRWFSLGKWSIFWHWKKPVTYRPTDTPSYRDGWTHLKKVAKALPGQWFPLPREFTIIMIRWGSKKYLHN